MPIVGYSDGGFPRDADTVVGLRIRPGERIGANNTIRRTKTYPGIDIDRSTLRVNVRNPGNAKSSPNHQGANFNMSCLEKCLLKHAVPLPAEQAGSRLRLWSPGKRFGDASRGSKCLASRKPDRAATNNDIASSEFNLR